MKLQDGQKERESVSSLIIIILSPAFSSGLPLECGKGSQDERSHQTEYFLDITEAIHR